MSFLVAPNSPKQTASSVNAPTVPTQVAGSSASSPTNGDNSTEQILQQISNLQDLENKKYNDLNALLASSNPTPDNIAQQKVLIGDITQLSNIRSDLFDTLLTHAQNNMKVNESMNANLQDKHTIITLKETDLKARKAAIAAINQKNENALKMVDINVYYKKQYEARVTIMKYVVLICFLVIFFVVLMNLGWLPQEFVTVLVVIIIFVGALYIGSLIYDTYQRSNINYDEYNWNFDSQKMNSRISDQPKKNKSVSTDRTCSSDDGISSKFDSMYKSVSSSAASLEDSMSSKATSFMNDVTGTGNGSGSNGSNPTPSSSSSSLPSTSTSTVSTMMAGTAPSVQSNISESFMLSKVSKKYFSEPIMNDNNNNNKGINAFVIEDSYGRI
jgi:hypothetical protein